MHLTQSLKINFALIFMFSKYPATSINRYFYIMTLDINGKDLTLQEAASGMHPEWQGGADSARPYKNQFTGHFDPIF